MQIYESNFDKAKKGAKLFAFLSFFLAFLVFLGWVFDLKELKQISPSWVSMKANTSICLMISAIAVYILTVKKELKKIFYFLPGCVLLISIATIFQDIAKVDLNIDQMIFKEDQFAFETTHPGRMSPITAVSFIILNVAIIFAVSNIKSLVKLFTLLTFVVFFISYFSILTYLFSAEAGLVIANLTKIAFHSATGFLFLSLALLFSKPTTGIIKILYQDFITSKILRQILVFTLLFLPFLSWVTLKGIEQSLFNIGFGLVILVITGSVLFTGFILIAVVRLNKAESRTRDAYEEIYLKNQELHQVNYDLDSFVYSASHDLKTPIANIEGIANVVFESLKKDEESIQLAKLLYESIGILKSKINELTEISRIQREQVQQKETINLHSFIYSILKDLKEELDISGTILEVNVDKHLQIKESKRILNVILYNLISNAIKFRSPERKSFVRIKYSEVENYHVFSVSDNGLGFDVKHTDKVFQMFKRLHDNVEGVGIGLYIVKRLVEKARGVIEVESKVNIGSTFTVKLPKEKLV